MFESTSWVDIVAWIDTHLLTIKGCNVGRMGGKMHISHQRLGVTVSLQLGRDVFHILRLSGALSRETYQFATGIDDTFGLCHTGGGIVGVGGGH